MLLRFDPLAEFDRMSRRLERSDSFLTADAYRDGEAFVIHLDIPGVDADAIETTVEKDTLTVSAQRKWEVGEDTQIVMQERPTGTFTRRFILGEALDTENIEAGYDHGVLTIRIPVREAAKPRKIEVGNVERALTS